MKANAPYTEAITSTTSFDGPIEIVSTLLIEAAVLWPEVCEASLVLEPLEMPRKATKS